MPVSVGLIAQVIEKIAPKFWAEEWDNVGLLVGEASMPVERVLLTLDGTREVIEEAKERKVQLIIAHHPILFKPLKNLCSDNLAAQVPIQLLKEGIAYYAAHTNLDQSLYSASWTLGKELGLGRMELLAPTASENLVKLSVFVPRTHLEAVRQALVKVGVGEGTTDGPHGNFYAESFFSGEGIGMFRPLPGAEPSIGKIGELTRVEEAKLESILPERLVDRAVKALRNAHPYEEPAFDLISLRNPGRPRGYGVVGYLQEPELLTNVVDQVKMSLEKLNSPLRQIAPYRLASGTKQIIRKIAIVNGSGGSFISKALFKGVDLLITGDVDHHGALDALEAGMAILDIGHFASEVPMVMTLAELLRQEKILAGIEILTSEKMHSPWNV